MSNQEHNNISSNQPDCMLKIHIFNMMKTIFRISGCLEHHKLNIRYKEKKRLTTKILRFWCF